VEWHWVGVEAVFPPDAIRLYSARVRRIVTLLCIWWLALGCARTASEYLHFGMSTEEAAATFGASMVYVTERHGGEIYLVRGPAPIPGIYPPYVEERLYLQFRKGKLTGWKNEWDARKFWF
jgi:hypothetical protein